MAEKLIIKQWGNSKAVRIPQAVINQFCLKNDDYFEAIIDVDSITLIPVTQTQSKKRKFSKYKLDDLLTEMKSEVGEEFPIIKEWEEMQSVGLEKR